MVVVDQAILIIDPTGSLEFVFDSRLLFAQVGSQGRIAVQASITLATLVSKRYRIINSIQPWVANKINANALAGQKIMIRIERLIPDDQFE